MYHPQNIGPVIKSILDRGEHKNDKWKKEIEDVEKNLVLKLKELCSDKYGEFIVSIEGMLDAKSLIAQLGEQILTCQDLEAGVFLEQNVKRLDKLKECRICVRKASEQVKACLKVAKLVSDCCNFKKLNVNSNGTTTIGSELLQSLLEDSANAKQMLKQTLFSAKCQKLYSKTLERFRSHLHTIVTTDFSNWLQKVEMKAGEWGKCAISQWMKPSDVEESIFRAPEQIVDWTPVRNMILMEGESFGKSYLSNYRRKVYVDMAKQKYLNEGHIDLVEHYEDILFHIVGYLIVDRSLWMQYELFDFSVLVDLAKEIWDFLQKRIIADVQSIEESDNSHTVILHLKNFIVSTNATLTILDELKPECLLLSFVGVYPFYQKQLLRNLKRDITKLFQKDENYSRIVVHSKEDFLERVVCFGLHRLLPQFKEQLLISIEDIDEMEFPLEIPMSATFPNVAGALEKYVENLNSYISGWVKIQKTCLTEALAKAFKVVLSSMRESIERDGRNLSVLAQSRENSRALILICDHLEGVGKLYESKAGRRSSLLVQTRKSIMTFQQSIQGIFTEQLKCKVMEFITFAPEHLLATKMKEASMWPDDLILYLTHTLNHQLQYTERSFRDELLLSIFNAVKMELVEFWCHAKHWNVIGAWNLLTDVERLEDRVLDMNRKETIVGIEEVFPGHLKDLLNLVLGGNIIQILDSKERRWSNIPRKTLIQILEQFEPLGVNIRCPKRINSLTRLTVDVIIRELRNCSN